MGLPGHGLFQRAEGAPGRTKGSAARSTVSGRVSPRPGCSVARTALPPASPERWAEPARPHLSAAHDVAPPEPAAREPRRRARRKLPQTAPCTESSQPAERSHRARRAHAHTARSPTPSLLTTPQLAPPPRALRSNQSAVAGAGPLGICSPSRRRPHGFRVPILEFEGGVRW